MRYRIRRIAVHQTALVVAILYGFLALVITPLFYLVSRFNPEGETVPLFALLLFPVVYALIVYVVAAIGCWLYNLIAGWVGGIEFVLEERPEAQIPSSVRT